MKKIFYLFLLSVFLFSCEDDIGELGRNLVPPEDEIATYIDSLENITFSYSSDDTIRSRSYTVMLGSYEDDIFGKQTANLASRFYHEYSSYFAISPDSFIIDTIYLSFTLANYRYGDTNSTQHIKVYELDEELTVDDYEAYYTTGEFPEVIRNGNYSSLGEGSAVLDTTNSYIDVILDGNDFYQRMHDFITDNYVEFEEDDDDDTDLYEDEVYPFLDSLNEEFVKLFHGLYIETVESGMIANYYDPVIEIAYHRYEGDTNSLYFELVTEEASFLEYDDRDDNFTYIYPMTMFENELLLDDNAGIDNQSETYVCGGMAYKTELKFDPATFDRWLDDGDSLIVNLALITIPYDTTIYDDLQTMDELTLIGQNYNYTYTNSDGEEEYYYKEWTASTLTVDDIDDDVYDADFDSHLSITITDFLYDFQSINEQKGYTTSISDYTFYLVDPSNYNDVDRAILEVGENGSNVDFVIVYTTY